MKKAILSGIITLLSIMALAALTYGQTSGHAGHAMPAAPGGADKGGDGRGHGKMEGGCMGGHGIMGVQGKGLGMMGGHGKMGGPGMGSGMMGGHGMGGRMMEAEHHLARVLEGLALDEQQKKVIGEIKSSIKKDTIRRMADMIIARIELKDLLLQDPLDMKAVEAKVKQLGSLRTDMHLSHLKALENIRTKLTPEQRKKLVDMIKNGPMMMMPD
jgi:Spy/CpxP family protein refolding chaperone